MTVEPKDTHLADALGELSMALEELDNARALKGRLHAEEAMEALQEYTREKGGDDADE